MIDLTKSKAAFEEAKKFEKNYKISLDKDGNLRTVKLEQTKSIKVEEAEK